MQTPHRFPTNRKPPPAVTGLTLLAVVLGMLLLGGALLLLTQKAVTVNIDGYISTIYTRRETVRDVLDDMGITVQPEDALTPALNTPLQNGTLIQVARARSVLVIADGLRTELLTRASTPADLLAEAGITLARYDRVLVDGDPITNPATPLDGPLPAVVEVQRAVEMTIEVDGQGYTVYTTAPTIGEALYAIGVTLYLADEVSPSPATPPQDGLHVTVRRSVPVSITVEDVTISTRTRADTVAGALAENGLALVGQDYSIPAAEAPLPADGAIRVVRVWEDVQVERYEIPYETVYRPDDSMELDARRIVQPGQPGIAQRRTRTRYENGVAVSEVEEPAYTEQEAVDEVIAYGTEIVIRTLDTPEGPREYWRVIHMLATSYAPSTSSKPLDAPSYGITGTGVPLRQGIVAVDPTVIPYFTQVYVPGYGDGLAADSGGAINGRRIDLGYGDDDLVLWYSWVDVYLLTPPPPPEDILYVLP